MKIQNIVIMTLLVNFSIGFAKKEPHRTIKQIIPAQPIIQADANKSFAKKTGVAKTLAHVNYKASSTTPESIAREYLSVNRSQFQLKQEHLQELYLSNIREGLAVTTVRFKQLYQGIEVFNASVAVSINHKNTVTFVSNELKPVTNFKQFKSKVSLSAAQNIATNYLGATFKAINDSATSVIYQKASGYISAYKIEIISNSMQGNWLFVIDAQTGEILMAKDTNAYQNATGNVFDPDPLSSSGSNYGGGLVDNNDTTTSQLNAQLFQKDLSLTRTGNTYFLKGDWAESVDISPPNDGIFSQSGSNFNYNRAHAAFESVNTYYHIDTFLNYLNNDLGLNVRPYQYSTGVKFDSHGDNGADNSFYTSGSGSLVFGEGCVDDAEDADVVIHELGHGIHDWITNGGLSQVNGLSEGTGDYLAQSYSRSRNSQIWNTSDPAYNYMFSWDGHNECWNGRITNYSANYQTGLVGQIHTDGQIWATCLMKVWDQIGRENTDKIVIEGLAMTNSNTNQQQAAQAVMQAAVDLGLNQDLTTIKDTLNSCGYTVNFTAGFNVSLSNSGNATINNDQTFSANINGGSAPFTYAWDINNDGAIDGTDETITANYASAYNDTVNVTITDSQGVAVTSTFQANIQAPKIEVVNNTNSATQLCGNGNNFVDPGERWSIPVSLKNNSSINADNSFALFTKNSSTANIEITAQDDFGNGIGNCDRQFIDITTTGTELILEDGNPNDAFPAQDEGVTRVTLPQAFNFYGQTISSLSLSSNGYFSTDATESGFDYNNRCPLPALPNTGNGNGSSTNARIMPLHDDLITQHIFYQHFNDCPRVSELGANLSCDIFMYNDVDLFSTNNTQHFNFEAILYPTVNQWVFQYDGLGINSSSVSVGIQNDQATDGVSFSCNNSNTINTQEAVCVYHRDNQSTANPDVSFINLEKAFINMGNLQANQQHNGAIEFSINENAACDSPISFNMQTAVFDKGFNQENTTVLSTKLGNNGVCSVVNNCSPNSGNDIQPTNGLWSNPNRSGNGYDMYVKNNKFLYVQYTTKTDRSPIWYLTDFTDFNNNQASNTINKFSYNGAFSDSTQSKVAVGTSNTVFVDADHAIQTRQLNGKFSADLIESSQFSSAPITEQRTGLWSGTSPRENGWGSSIGTQGDTEVVVNYLYDNNGQPYWILGAGGNTAVADINMKRFNSFCPHCPSVEVKSENAGTVRIDYDATNRSATIQSLQINVNDSDHPSQWNRSNMPIQIIID